jgi:ribosomal protein L11 methyltransferase
LAATDPLTYVASIEAASPAAEAIAAALEAAEAPAVLAVALFERGAGCVEVSAHYADEPSRGRLAALIEGAAPGHDTGALKIEALAHRNWVAEAERLRGPVRAGRFVVHGRHDRGKVPAGRNTLEIDASLAFGTAHHATTRGCLIALDRILKRERPCSILDIVEVAAENIRVNRVQGWVSAVEADGLEHPALRRGKADLLFANILLRPLLGLAPAFAGALRPGGICVLSGLLTSQARQVEARFRALGFTLESRVVLDGWAILLLRRGSGRRAAAD